MIKTSILLQIYLPKYALKCISLYNFSIFEIAFDHKTLHIAPCKIKQLQKLHISLEHLNVYRTNILTTVVSLFHYTTHQYHQNYYQAHHAWMTIVYHMNGNTLFDILHNNISLNTHRFNIKLKFSLLCSTV